MEEFRRWLKEMDNMLYATRYEHSALASGIARGWLWPLFNSHDFHACLDYRVPSVGAPRALTTRSA